MTKLINFFLIADMLQIKVINANKKLFNGNCNSSQIPHVTLLERAPCLFSLSCDIAPRTPTRFKKSPRVFFKVVIFISLSPFPVYQLFLFPTNFLSFSFPVIPQKTIPDRRAQYFLSKIPLSFYFLAMLETSNFHNLFYFIFYFYIICSVNKI